MNKKTIDLIVSLLETAVNFISKLSLQKTTDPKQLLVSFERDFVDIDLFAQGFRSIGTQWVQTYMSTVLRDASTDFKSGHILGAIRTFYLCRWLEQKQYVEKLVEQNINLMEVDEFGDLSFKKWHKQIERFTTERISQIDDYLTREIPDFYRQYAKAANEEFCLSTNIYSPLYTRKEAIFELALDISDYTDQIISILQEIADAEEETS